MSMDVKNDLRNLEASLDVIDSMRTFWKMSLMRLNEVVKQTQAPSPSMKSTTPTAAEMVRERAASIPPTKGREAAKGCQRQTVNDLGRWKLYHHQVQG